jgi:hypothetical protein
MQLKTFFSAFAVTILSLTSAPRSAPGMPLATFSQINLVANIETIGVTVSGSSLPNTAQLMYRKSTEASWHTGYPLMLISDGRLAGSLFGLSASTSYYIKVIDGANEIDGSATTQPDALEFTPSKVLRVDAKAPPGGDGSPARPFNTIQDGVNHATPGTQVLVADGIYREQVTFPASGAAGKWIQVKAESSAAILDGSQKLGGNIWTQLGSSKKIYFTKVGASLAYLGRDHQRFYEYDDLSSLKQGIGHNKVHMNEGWYYETSTSRLFIRVDGDPTSHSWQMPYLNQAFNITGQSWLWIEGFEMRFYGTGTDACGICTLNASHIVLRWNTIHNIQLGIYVNWTGSPDQGNDTRIEYNEIYDTPVNTWPWNAVKGTNMEDTAIVVRGHTGAIVRGNSLHDLFNGVYTGTSAALTDTNVAFDVDVYNNHIFRIGDDALEPEGACINNRFRGNIVDSIYDGMSLAPIQIGPTWVLRNLFTNYTGRAFKLDLVSKGIALVFQNTSWSNARDVPAVEVITPVHNIVMRNNIFQSRGYGMNEIAIGSWGDDWNYDDFYVTRPGPHYKWEKIEYKDLISLCPASGLECNGFEDSPGFVNPGTDFTLLPTSPNIDRGILIPGINDNFSGKAPDLGAFEYVPPKP